MWLEETHLMTRALLRASAVPGVLVASLVAGCVFTSLGRTHELVLAHSGFDRLKRGQLIGRNE
jgi:hypothetical protein